LNGKHIFQNEITFIQEVGMVYDKMEKRNKLVDFLTLKWCKELQSNILKTLRTHYATNLPPVAVDFMEPRLFYGPGYSQITIVYDAETEDFRPCSYSIHPRHPDAVVPTVLARAGVENYKWRMMRDQYFDFFYAMKKNEFLKDDIVREAQKHACMRACHVFKEELVSRVFHPKNMERWVEQGIDEMMFGY
jgi:hypothetical protein